MERGEQDAGPSSVRSTVLGSCRICHGSRDNTHTQTHQEAALARALENVLLNQAKILGFEMLPCRKI